MRQVPERRVLVDEVLGVHPRSVADDSRHPSTHYDRLLTVLVLAGLRTRLGMRGTDFIHASGDRRDLLDDALHGQRVRLVWIRYGNSNRLYLDGPVNFIPKTVAASSPQRS